MDAPPIGLYPSLLRNQRAAQRGATGFVVGFDEIAQEAHENPPVFFAQGRQESFLGDFHAFLDALPEGAAILRYRDQPGAPVGGVGPAGVALLRKDLRKSISGGRPN